MKHYKFKFSDFSKNIFFPKERIKTKIQIINILLEATRYILSNPEVEEDDSVGEIELVVDKMSRLFFKSDNKSYSIVFPFKVYENENSLELSFKNNMVINSYIISKTKSAINSTNFNDNCILGFADSLHEFENENEELWIFLKELMLMEDGYIRYDIDPVGFKEANDMGKPHRHPLNHYDLFYTNRVTFKIGLINGISFDNFLDLVNVKTDCQYLKN